MISLSGSFVALITPFRKGNVDYKALKRLVEFQIDSGTSGIVPCGTTGESPTLNHEEHREVIAATVRFAARRVPVIAGAGSNSTDEAVEITRHAEQDGADAVLSVVPYYNKPTQEGMFLHFKTIAHATKLPIILYNIPGRCAAGLAVDTLERLAQIKNIVAVKESTGSMDQATEILLKTRLEVLSGDDSLTLPLMSLGATGVISVLANIFPKEIVHMISAFYQKDSERVRAWHRRMFPLIKALFIETNPIPVKAAMRILKMDTGDVRLPLSTIETGHEKILRGELIKFQRSLQGAL